LHSLDIGSAEGQHISYFADFKKAYNSVWREVLYTDFGICIKLVRLITMCWNKI